MGEGRKKNQQRETKSTLFRQNKVTPLRLANRESRVFLSTKNLQGG